MFITYNETGKVTAYSDKQRNPLDLQSGETEVEVDLPFAQIDCQENKLIFNGEELLNDGQLLATKL